ncbi:hypothetical protein L1987_26684 [Smallanthus sonchifolius]|uniref:Uncharacterized protein n=1 Tax=Smallanthus sonchifolius TaxID=185202 RepID=A0ACB9IBI3_9ASTR|nr:hypothetical protein L1987_26684 [Smallanthus sonchifolius]
MFHDYHLISTKYTSISTPDLRYDLLTAAEIYVMSAIAVPFMQLCWGIFADACFKGFNGVPDVVECSLVK